MSHARYTVFAAIAVILSMDAIYRTVDAYQKGHGFDRAITLLIIAFVIVLVTPVRPETR